MTSFGCNCTCRCTLFAIIASVITGVVTAFLHIAGIVTATPIFLWVALGIGVVYLGSLLVSTLTARRSESGNCACSSLSALLLGLLGTILLATVLLAIGIVATSVLSAVLVGILVFFLTLTFTSTACLIRILAGCNR